MSMTANASASFLGLAGELRNRIYELVLLQEEPIDPLVCYGRQGNLAPGLFRANRNVHREATLFFYSRNVFKVTDAAPVEVLSFLEQIGSKNAGYIRHIIIAFPTILYLDPGEVTLEDDSVETLEAIQTGCASLWTLETSLYTTESMEIRLDNLDNHKLATEGLGLVNTHFRAISSIQEIILNVFEDGPSDCLRSIMKTYGWTISTTKNEEEDDGDKGYSDFGDDDYGYNDFGYESDSADTYDIDNDSDFWRRAAD